MKQLTVTPAVTQPEPVSLKTSIAKVDAKSVGIAAQGLLYNKV
jgi:hypothetical protein